MSKPTISEIEAQLIDDFALFDDKMQKYEHIIELGKELESLPDDKKVESALVKGCQSQVWLHANEDGENIHFDADSDAFIVRGLVSMLMKVYSDQPIKEVANADFNFVKQIGLQEMLSPTRKNGLASMLKQLKYYAVALQAKQQQL